MRQGAPRSGDRFSWEASPGLYYGASERSSAPSFSDASQLASVLGQGLDPLAITQEAALGFQLGCRTIYRSVCRLLPGEQFVHGDDSLCVEPIPILESKSDVLENLAETVCSALDSGAALEATGGLDSRLLLAVGLANGSKPKVSFTIGAEDNPDALAASSIAAEFGFPHRRIPLVVDRECIARDAIDIVRASGYSINASNYAWLRGTLSALDSVRSAQITGAAGEVVGSFYYTPLDSCIEPLGLQDLWVRHRLLRPWINWRILWGRDRARELENTLLSEVNDCIGAPGATWRENVDLFYRNERIRRWGIPVLDASRLYYDVVAPYLSSAYFSWAETLPVQHRFGRLAQRQLLSTAHPALALFGGKRKVSLIGKFGQATQKIVRRVAGFKRTSSLGSIQTATALASARNIRDYIQAVTHESDTGFDASGVERVLACPGEYPELLGVLVTAAVAWQDLKNSRSLSSNEWISSRCL